MAHRNEGTCRVNCYNEYNIELVRIFPDLLIPTPFLPFFDRDRYSYSTGPYL